MTSSSSQLVYGIESPFVRDIKDLLNRAATEVVDFVVAPLFHPRLQRGGSTSRLGPITRSDVVLSSRDWTSNVVGSLSEWIDLDNLDVDVRLSSEAAFTQEVRWAVHLGLQAIVMQAPRRSAYANYCKCLNQVIDLGSYQQVWIELPLMLPIEYGDLSKDSWMLWNKIRTLTSHNPKLGVALTLSDGCEIDDDILGGLDRWVAEPVKALVLSTRLFIINPKGYPVLSAKYQKIVKTLICKSSKTHIIIRGKARHNGCYKGYLSYLEYLRSQTQLLSESEKFTAAYRDTLQMPLQPLMDNLESNTYEVFEQDPTKYANYEEAIKLALVDIWRRLHSQNNEIGNVSGDISEMISNVSPVLAGHLVVMVVGAGRGPLVHCALAASAAVSIPVKIIAVEKNPNAIITLRNRAIRDKWTNVTIIEKDMRLYRPDELADILVSELLGSWGDNELSPECLDGAQVYLKPGGVSIPQSSTSFIAPVSTAKLWTAARDMPGINGLNTPFVVKFNDSYLIDQAKSCFRFEHPNLHLTPNTRYQTLTFECKTDAVVHGFMGTFESVLYGDVMISINPRTHTPGMFSWFPLFIPLATPVAVQQGDSITFHCWRCCDSRQVWYEWCLTEPLATPIQNKLGKSYWIGLH